MRYSATEKSWEEKARGTKRRSGCRIKLLCYPLTMGISKKKKTTTQRIS